MRLYWNTAALIYVLSVAAVMPPWQSACDTTWSTKLKIVTIRPFTEQGFPGGSVVKNWPANAGDTRGLWKRKWQPTPVLVLGILHGQRSLAVIVHGVTKGRT